MLTHNGVTLTMNGIPGLAGFIAVNPRSGSVMAIDMTPTQARELAEALIEMAEESEK